MFDTLKRIQLQRRGLSCGKVRRKHGDNDFGRLLRSSPWVKATIFALFVVSICVLMTLGETEGTLYGTRKGLAFLAAIAVFSVGLVHFFVNHPRNFANNARVLLIFGVILLQVSLLKAIGPVLESSGWSEQLFFLVIPYALAPMTLSVLVGRNFALFAMVATSIFGGFLLPLGDFFPYLVINLLTGFVAIFATYQMRRRTRFLRSGFYCGLAAMLGCIALGQLGIAYEQIPAAGAGAPRADWVTTLWHSGVPLLVGMATGLGLGGVLQFLERGFQATSTISWVELADLNHPLLRRMSMEAPGTYHHSLMVANLSVAAAESIGANPTLCRVCSYFHDIGKMNKPEYFIENIGAGGANPHDDLTPNMSAIVITAHVKDGVDMSLKHRLNDEIIDVIEQHHGTSTIFYFYRKALIRREELQAQADAGEISADDVPEVDESGFRYPGPKPQFRESAIISLADAIESASRSLEKPTPQRVEQLVDDIVRGRILDGQLDDSDLTMQELAAIRESFAKTLRSMLHSRISYRQEPGESEAGGDSKEPKSAGGGEPPTSGGGRKKTRARRPGKGGSKEAASIGAV